MSLIAALLAATVRHRRPALVASVLLAIGHAAASWRWPWVSDRLFPVSVAVVLMLAALTAVSRFARRPGTLAVRPERHVFEAPAGPAPVYAALCCLALAAGLLSRVLCDARTDGLRPFELVWAVFWLIVAVRLIDLAWRGSGAQFRPDGIRNRDVFGSVTVPWAALDPDLPPLPSRQSTVLLTYARPGLVHRRGVVLNRRLLRADTVDARFLARVVQHYLRHPEDRPTIGTPTEYARLLRRLA